MPTLIQLHGPPSAHAEGQAPLPLSAREAALLAWLHLEGATPRARIAGLLWPGSREAQARANLRQTLARLRRSAGELVADDEGLLRLAEGVAVAPPEAGPARSLLHGLAFDDSPEFAEWLEARREQAQRERQRVLLAAGRAALEACQTDEALAAADALLADQPENEEAWRLRMEALYRRGDRAGAIAAWDACRHVLRGSFGIAPSAATAALGRLILGSDGEAGPAAAALLPVALQRPPQLVGRAGVLEALAQALALGQSLVITAPGGMGKTRLLQQLVPMGAGTVSVMARPGDDRLAGALLGRLLEAVLARAAAPAPQGPLAALLPGADAARVLRSEVEHRRVLLALQALFDAAAHEGLRHVVLDDLHFADEASLELLRGLVGRWLAAAGEPRPAPQVVLAARAEELAPAGWALCELVALHAAGRRVALPPLAREDLAELVDSLARAMPAPLAGSPDAGALAAALHAALGGNPAFVLEALRSLWLAGGGAAWAPGAPVPVPPTLVDSVLARLQRLDADALQLAQLAAVAEGDFVPGLAAAVFGCSPLALAPRFAALQAAQVFDEGGFAHDLVYEAVRRSLPAALAAPLHALVAEHLQRRGGAPARVAHHWLAAGEHRAAAPWFARAAEAARGRWQLLDAARAWAQAAALYDAPGPRSELRETAVAMALAAARAWLRVHRHDDADAALARAEPGLRGPAERAAWRALRVARALATQDIATATAEAPALLAELAEGADGLGAEERVHALRAATTTVQHGVPAAAVLALCDALAPGFERLGGEAWIGFALARSGPLLWDAQPAAAAAGLAEAWARLDADSDPELRRDVANQLLRARQALGDLDGALALAGALRALLLPDTHDAPLAAEVLALSAQVQLALGRPGPAFDDLAAAHERLRQAGIPAAAAPVLVTVVELLVLIGGGRLDEAGRALAAAGGADAPGAHALRRQVLLIAAVRLAAARGEPVTPWLQALRALPALSEGSRLHREIAAAVQGALDEAELEALLAAVARRGQRGLERSVLLALATRHSDAGRHAEAAALARRALVLARHVDAWNDDTARAWLQAGEVLAAAEAADEAAVTWLAGARWVDEAAATLDDAEARRAWRETHPLHHRLLQRARA